MRARSEQRKGARKGKGGEKIGRGGNKKKRRDTYQSSTTLTNPSTPPHSDPFPNRGHTKVHCAKYPGWTETSRYAHPGAALRYNSLLPPTASARSREAKPSKCAAHSSCLSVITTQHQHPPPSSSSSNPEREKRGTYSNQTHPPRPPQTAAGPGPPSPQDQTAPTAGLRKQPRPGRPPAGGRCPSRRCSAAPSCRGGSGSGKCPTPGWGRRAGPARGVSFGRFAWRGGRGTNRTCLSVG